MRRSSHPAAEGAQEISLPTQSGGVRTGVETGMPERTTGTERDTSAGRCLKVLVDAPPASTLAPRLGLGCRARQNPGALGATQVAQNRGGELTRIPVNLTPVSEAAEQIGNAQPNQRPQDQYRHPRDPTHKPFHDRKLAHPFDRANQKRDDNSMKLRVKPSRPGTSAFPPGTGEECSKWSAEGRILACLKRHRLWGEGRVRRYLGISARIARLEE
jgi:hypothetical protein